MAIGEKGGHFLIHYYIFFLFKNIFFLERGNCCRFLSENKACKLLMSDSCFHEKLSLWKLKK